MSEENTIVAGVYQHYKGGMYEVLQADTTHSETQEKLVVYQAISTQDIWVRPLAMFAESVIVGDNTVPRFKLIEIV